QALQFLPQRIRELVERAGREKTKSAATSARFYLRRHERDVREIRAKVDSRIDRLRALYYQNGLPVKRGNWSPGHLRHEPVLVHKRETSIEAAWDEPRRAYPEIPR